MKLLLCLFFFSTVTHAQMALLPEPLKAIPELPTKKSSIFDQFSFKLETLNYSEDQINKLAIELDNQFKKALLPLQQQTPACNQSPQIENYLIALQTSGQLDLCSQVAKSCENKTSSPKPFLVAALCESARYAYNRADYFFELATNPVWKNSADYQEAIFQRASYSLFGHHETLVDGILSLMPNTNAQNRKFWKAILQRTGEMDLGDLTKKQVDQFLKDQINSATGSFKGLLLSLQIRIATRDSRHKDAIDLMLTKSAEIKNPLFWYYVAYNGLYYGLDQKFAWSRKIYNVYNQYANPWMNFPLENNTYNYTQIYGSVCRNQLIQASSGENFNQIKRALRSGEITVQAALSALDQLKGQYSGKADYLAAYAGLLALQGRHADALNLYWEAHNLCPYYNRAHWGLTVAKRFFQYSNRPDYNQLKSRIDREMQGRVIPQAISTYIVNWNSLNADVQKHVAYGARTWLPYMQTLEQNQMHSYIKYAFDLLSESPNLERLKDVRIGGGNYPHDNRLWDDVRGVGGGSVVADLAEVYHTVHGDYNLLGHEVAHQFHYLLKLIQPNLAQCIVDQYDRAKAIGNFPDAYSSQNKEEHFAQGVTYFTVPVDSPARFGLNQNWVKRNNPAQFNFIDSIDLARGDFNKISCQ